MVTAEAIDQALSAHAQWKKRLRDAIETEKSEFKPDNVKKDNACQFGQWLYALPEMDIKNEHYVLVKTLHADFHRVAGEILELALAGKKEEALRKLEYGGQYGSVSGSLVLALNDWKASL